MGVNFTAIGEHQLNSPDDLSLEALVGLPAIRDVVRWTEGWRDKFFDPTEAPYWAVDPGQTLDKEFHENGVCLGFLSGGFVLTLGRNLFELYHLTRWHMFVMDAEANAFMRHACYDVVNYLNGTAIFYLPDNAYDSSAAGDLIYEGAGLGQLEEWLTKNCGPPRLDPNIIYPEDFDGYFQRDGYYYDDFSGLKKRPRR